MAHDVFISYSKYDKDVANAICSALEEKAIRCWIAPRDIPPGADYPDALMRALGTSRLLVLVFSSHTNESRHVVREVDRACDKGLVIVPFRVEDVPMSPGLEYYLSTPQWLDAREPPLKPHVDRLAETIGEQLKREPAALLAACAEHDDRARTLDEETMPGPHEETDDAPDAEIAGPGPCGEPQRWAIARAFSHTPLGVLGVNDCGFSPDGQTVFTAGWPTLKLWAVRSARRLATLGEQIDVDKVNAGAFSPDGQTIAAAGPNQLEFYDSPISRNWLVRVPVIRPRAVLRGHNGEVGACAFSPDGLTLVSGSEDRTLKLWDVATGVCRGTLVGHTDRVSGCAVSPDGQTIASTSGDMTVRLWDAHSGELRSTLAGHSNGVLSCAFSPDGQMLVSASWDGTLRVWDATTNDCLAVLVGHKGGGVRACAFSPDGQIIVSASGDATIKLWSATTGACETTLMGHSGPVVACAFSPDGRMIISGSSERKKDCVRIWVAG